MIKSVLFAGLLMAAIHPKVAHAETIDMSTLKCSDVASFDENQAGLMLFWLHGYYGGQAGDTTVDLDAVTIVATKLGEACDANPDIGVMSALKTVVGG